MIPSLKLYHLCLLGFLSAQPLQSSDNVKIEYEAAHNNPTRQNWWDLADTLLCQGYSAEQIRDSLHSLLPGSKWFVLVQPPSGQWANSNPLDGYSDFHFQSNMCGKNLAVWTYSGPVSSCNENTSGVLARNLIDAAVSYGGSTANIRDYITNSNKESFLTISTKLFFSDEISYSLS